MCCDQQRVPLRDVLHVEQLVALVVSTLSFAQWHEMIITMSQLREISLWTAGMTELSRHQEPSLPRGARCHGCVTDVLAIVFLMTVSVRCVCTVVPCNRCRALCFVSMSLYCRVLNPTNGFPLLSTSHPEVMSCPQAAGAREDGSCPGL